MKATCAVVLAVTLVCPSSAFAQLAIPASASMGFSAASLDRAILATPVQPAASKEPCETSRARGRNDADDRHGTAGWFIGGLSAGLLATFLGAGAVTGGAAFTNPQPRDVPSDAEEYCYRDGYKSKAKNKNVVTSLLGGLIGAVTWIGIFVATSD